MPPTLVNWPSTVLQVLNYLVFTLALSINVATVSRRIATFKVFLQRPRNDSKYICDVSLMLTFLTSLLFTFISGIFYYAAGMVSESTCHGAILACVSIYAITKIFLYLFLLERVYLVHKTESRTLRRRCWSWLIGLALYSFGLPFAILLGFSNQFGFVEHNGMLFCHIGLKLAYALPIIAWDATLNLYLGQTFVLPLLKGSLKSEKAKALATRALLATLIGTLTSLTNFVAILVLRGEWSTICLLSCTADVLVNTLALALTTKNRAESGPREMSPELPPQQIISFVDIKD